jgi:hypothetical protein
LSAGKLIESSSDLGIVVKSIGADVTISSVVTLAGNVLSLSSIELVCNVVKSIGADVTISSVVTSAGNVLSLSSIELVGNVVSCGAIVSKYFNRL